MCRSSSSPYLNVSPVPRSTESGDWVWDDIQFLARFDSNKQNNITDSGGWSGAGRACGCWLLARSFLSFFSCSQFVGNFLLLSRLPLIAPCFQDRRDGHLLISGWLLISNHESVLDCLLIFDLIALHYTSRARIVDQKKTFGSFIAL